MPECTCPLVACHASDSPDGTYTKPDPKRPDPDCPIHGRQIS